MDRDLFAWAHPIRAQLAVEELERKLGIPAGRSVDHSELLDFANEQGEPPD